MEDRLSKLGFLSLLIALTPLAILAFVLLFISIAFALTGHGFGALFGMIILPFILLIIFAIDCTALIMGIAGIFQKNGNKMAALSGIILSLAPIILLVAFHFNG